MSILFARHGETDWNIAKRVQGTTDIPLNENGVKQTELNFGLFEGHTWDEISTLYPDELRKWQSDKRYNKAPKGESYQNLLERLFSALDQIMEEVQDDIDLGRDVLILTHGTVILSLLTLKYELDFETSYTAISIENAKIIKLESNDLWEIQQRLHREPCLSE